MAKKFLVNLDLAKNQILNAAIQNLSSAPSSPVRGQIYYNTLDYRIYFWDGTSWVDMSGDIRDVVGGNGLTASTSNGIVTLDVNVDNTTIELSGDWLQVKNGGITSAKINDLSTDIFMNAGTTAIPTAYAVKNYVDSITGGVGNLEGGWDVQTNMSFPTNIIPGATKKGDYWYATTAGTISSYPNSTNVNIGDVMIATINNASQYDASQWIVLETNRDQATESILGLVRIADQTTVNMGTDDQEAITALKLKTYLDSRTGGYATTIGDGISSLITVTHNLGTKDIVVVLYDLLSGEEVIADVLNQDPSGNFISVGFAVAPSSSSIRVVIKK
jgi:hypothetical protein